MAMLVDDVLHSHRAGGQRHHFSDPGTFNDPLDARPYVEVDIADSVLATVLHQLVKQRVTAEMRAGERTMRDRTRRADADIEQASRREADAQEAVRRVRYDGSRLIEASKVAAMLERDEDALREVDEAVLLRKAESWAYEREWRLLGSRGINGSPLELEEVVFGMRCEQAVKYGVMKALSSENPDLASANCERNGRVRSEEGAVELRRRDVPRVIASTAAVVEQRLGAVQEAEPQQMLHG